MNNKIKQHNSCVRVLEFLKLLFGEDIDIKDVNRTNSREFGEIEATETFLKYIYTLEASGLEIEKIDKKYSLCSYFSQIDLNEREIDILVEVFKMFDTCCIENQRSDFIKLKDKIIKLLSLKSRTLFIEKLNAKSVLRCEKLSQIAENFRKYVDLQQKLNICYNGKNITVEPKKVEIENKKIYLTVYNPKKANFMKLLTENISSIEVLPLKSNILNITETIVFEVYDRLAVNYRLRENEHVQNFSDNHKTIVNCGEDKSLLLKRLLKYGENCKIISPKTFKEEYLEELEIINSRLEGVLK